MENGAAVFLRVKVCLIRVISIGLRVRKIKIIKKTFTASTWEESTWKNPLTQIKEKVFKLNRRNKQWSAAFPQCLGQNAYCSRDIYLQRRKCYRSVT